MIRADIHPPSMRADYTFDFDYTQYSHEDHAIWHELAERQKPLLKGRACKEFMQSLENLNIMTNSGIPDMRRISDMLEKTTNWRIVTVPGLIPGDVFQEHLSKRQFPVTWWIRSRDEMDYLEEPDIFHDMFGHVPLLANPVFADYMQQFGQGAMKAKGLDALNYISRLYWFTVEFGLIKTEEGLRIYGAGIVSSPKESVYSLESKEPHRLKFDLQRIMRTRYHIDSVQSTYFVIDSFEQLFEETRPDFTDYYAKIRIMPEIIDTQIVDGDKVISRGTIK